MSLCTNTLSLPITIMNVICHTEITKNYETEHCSLLSTTYLTVFTTVAPQLLVWTIIRPYLKSLNVTSFHKLQEGHNFFATEK